MSQKAFSASLSTNTDWRKAISEAAANAGAGLKGKSCDLAVVFISENYKGLEAVAAIDLLRKKLPCAHLIGCNASGVVGVMREIEMEPAVSIMAMHLPGVGVHPFSLAPRDLGGLKEGADLVQKIDLYPTEDPWFLCLADPMTCDIESVLNLFNSAYPGRPILGGLASGVAVGRPNWLVLDDVVHTEGAVGVALTGDISFGTIVAQGCRPVGSRYTITKVDRHIVRELAGRPAFEVLRELIEELSPADRKLARHSLFAGLAMKEGKSDFKRGDFLIRNIMGYDPKEGTVMIGATVKAGQTLQFQLRDAATSEEDLRELLDSMPALPGKEPSGPAQAGALLFSCCGRGKGLYGKKDHDIGMIQSVRGPIPAVGFFANGEIGPIGNMNFLHGYTSSLVEIH